VHVAKTISAVKRTDAQAIDRTAMDKSGINDQRVIQFCKHFNISLSRMQLRALKIPNSLSSLSTVAWMNYYFKLVAESPPNASEELHLEPVKKKDIYEEYCFDVQTYGDLNEPIRLELFLDIWASVFDYVKIRKFKQCCGKCNLCARLSELRCQFTDMRGREEVTRLFEVHRITYMGERECYYARRLAAMHEPWNYLSTITDGMQQNRCLLPWYGHRKPPPVHLKQHLQGILMHGRQLRIYRSFSNVCVNANFCVHTWLLSLEEQYRKSKLPPTLYHQIDGGPEKANIHYLAICFMLVAKGLCLKVVLTRLLPGHTHEDIDALFALIWQMVKDEIVLTPSELEAAILKAFNKLKDVKVKDIHAVPNYAKYFEGYCDLSIGRFAKEDWTQLQMTFEKVADAERDRYPLGVKMTYKAYGQDEAIEIVDDPDKESITGLIPQLTLCPVCPADDEPPVCVMLSMPPASRTIEVDPGSRDFTVNRMERSYADKQPEVSAEWAKWRDEVSPQTDIATDYIGANPLYIPFLAELFSGASISGYEVDARKPNPRRVVGGKVVQPMRVVTATSSVTHSGAKGSKKNSKPARTVLERLLGGKTLQTRISQLVPTLSLIPGSHVSRRLLPRRLPPRRLPPGRMKIVTEMKRLRLKRKRTKRKKTKRKRTKRRTLLVKWTTAMMFSIMRSVT
jgi:hypothetical protein